MKRDDIYLLIHLIATKKPFMIGRRGICVRFRHNGFKWIGEVPRGDILMYFPILKVTSDYSALSCETPGWNPIRIILDSYDKLTELEGE